MKNIFLIGFMGTGKSTVARCMNRKYGMEILEMDERIAEDAGMSIPEIFERFGEEYFRDLETGLLAELENQENVVVSCGGGVVLREENIRKMRRNGCVVLLIASPETILERVKRNENRPLLRGKKDIESIKALMEARRERYESAADITVSVDGKGSEAACREIMKKIKGLEK